MSILDNAAGSPQTLRLSGTRTHGVFLPWSASPSSRIVGYYIYRGTTSGGERSNPLNSTEIAGSPMWTRNVAAGMTYYYEVKALDWSGVQSTASTET